METETLKNKSANELKEQLTDLFQERFNLRMQKGMGDLKRPHLVKKTRRDIARVKTLIKQKELGHA